METDNKEITKQEVKDWSIEVQEDGSIKVTQVIETEYVQSYREFLSDFRAMQKQVENAEEILTEDYQNKVKSDIEKMQEEVAKLKPYVDDSETKMLAYQEEKRLDQMLNKLKEELGKPMADINTAYMSAVWDHITKNEEKLMGRLSDDERLKFQKIKLRKIKNDQLQKRKSKKGAQ